jgi:hypothetical protein
VKSIGTALLPILDRHKHVGSPLGEGVKLSVRVCLEIAGIRLPL